jgi:hypothetical protein
MYGLTQSADEQVRLRACQWWTARRMGWKETNVSENVGKDGGPIERAMPGAPPPGMDVHLHSIAALCSRSAFAITLTEESDMAAAAITGDRRMPNAG